MTPGARLAAAAEVLDQVAASRGPAEGVLQAWGRANRYAGSGDRRAIADRVFRCLRGRGRLAAAGGAGDGRTLVLFSLKLLDGMAVEQIEALFSGAGYAPAPLSEVEQARLTAAEVGEGARLPEFVEADFRRRFGDAWEVETEALLQARAPLDVRVSGSREAVAAELRRAGLAVEETPWSAWGLRLPAGSDVQVTAAWLEGRVEVQDEGSQIAAALAGARPGELVVDYCAGGGGKTLALARALSHSAHSRESGDPGVFQAGRDVAGKAKNLGPRFRGDERKEGGEGSNLPHPDPLRGSVPLHEGERGWLIACDVNPVRLEAIRPRLARAGVEAELRLLGPEGEGVEDLEARADLVFVDAPCSGSGTWRRRPEAAWRLTEAEVERFHALQVEILGRAAKLVRPGGRLVYVTCSVLGRENEDSAAAFAEAHGGFQPVAVAEAAAQAGRLTEAGRARLVELAGGGHQVQLTPARTGTDGFFLAMWERMG